MTRWFATAAVGLAALAVVAPATAQYPLPDLTFDAELTPRNAGTKEKPKKSKLRIDLAIPREAHATVGQLVFNLPRHLRMSGAGFPICPAAELDATKDPSKCPRRSRVGSGTAQLVTGDSNTELDLTIFVGSRGELAIWAESTGLQIQKAMRGKIGRAGSPYGQKLTIGIPRQIHRPLPDVHSNLTRLKATIGGHNGRRGKKRRNLIGTVACPSAGRHRFEARARFIANPNPPLQGSSSRGDTSRCSK